MESDSVDYTITSPPYNFNLRIHYGKYGGRSIHDQNKYGSMFNDGLPMDEYFDWQRQCIEEMMRVSRNLVFYNIQMITGNKVALFRLLGHFADKIKEIIIWDKINAEPAIRERVMNSGFEFILVFDKNNAISRQFDTFNAERGVLSNIVRIGKNHQRQEMKHKAMFPIQLPKYIIHNFTKENETILDPFMGVGTTAVACVSTNRHYIGFETNKEFYDKSLERIDKEKQQTTLDLR